MTNKFNDWTEALEEFINQTKNEKSNAFLRANADTVKRALAIKASVRGAGSDEAGSCVVVNISSAHIHNLISNGYKNCYDLPRTVGKEPPSPSKTRIAVDSALEKLHGKKKEDIYFAAIEINGCGIGFYGDFCLVLKANLITDSTVLLDRNSYDLMRDPLQVTINKTSKAETVTVDEARLKTAFLIAGHVKKDSSAMGAIKVLQALHPAARLLTIGMISNKILDDEDYLEILLESSFTFHDLQEVRLSPAESTLEERIYRQSVSGDAPSFAQMIWRSRRLYAEAQLKAVGVPVRIATSSGRRKG